MVLRLHRQGQEADFLWFGLWLRLNNTQLFVLTLDDPAQRIMPKLRQKLPLKTIKCMWVLKLTKKEEKNIFSTFFESCLKARQNLKFNDFLK